MKKLVVYKRIFAVIITLAVFGVSAAQALADFDPNKIIDDKVFSDTQTFGGASGIQQFLDSKHSVLANTSPDFLQQLREPTDTALKTALQDPEPNLGRLRSAAELIWDASVKTGINPQVILVTLQKEQSLITKTFTSPTDLQRALNISMGFGCPDSGGCDPIFVGFYYQLFGNLDAAGDRYVGAPGSLMRSFTTTNGRGPGVDAQNQTFGTPLVRTSRVGDTITLTNTLGGPQNPQQYQAVTLSNLATAALYRYTPHVYNGNYNFWRFFNEWFRYPNGTLIRTSSDSQVYIINNGLKSPIPNFVIAARGLNPATTIVVSPTEFDSYNTGPMLGPVDNTIVRVATDPNNQLFVFENNQKHPVSNFVLSQRGLNAANALVVSQQEADIFPTSTLLAPKDGTLIKADDSGAVYVIMNGQKRAMSAFVFAQYKYSFKNVVTLPASEVAQYPDGGFLLPKNGTLVKASGDPTVYVLQDQILHPISGTVFSLYKYSFKNIVLLNAGELATAVKDGFVAPPDGTYFRAQDTGAYYYYKNGSKHSISPFVLKQRNVTTVAVKLGADESNALMLGTPLAPKDGTLIKGDGSGAIYVISKGQKKILDYNTWVRTYGKRAPNVLPQAEVDSYENYGAASSQ